MESSKELEQELREFSNLFELARDYLTKLAYYDSFISDLASEEPESLEFLSSSFSLLKELGRLSGNTVGLAALVSVYKSNITKTNNNFSEIELNKLFSVEYQGDGEWVDELSYIHIWVLNSYQLNLKKCSVGDIQKSHNPEIELELRTIEDEEERSEKKAKKKGGDWTKNSFAVYRNLLSSKFSFGEGISDDGGFEEIISKTQALERLEREIRSGRIYIYHSKPVKNLKLKQILSYIFLAGLVVSLVAFLKTFITYLVKSNGSENHQHILFSIMSFIFFLLARNENGKYLDNENFKYSFSRRIFYYYFFLSSFFFFNKGDVMKLFNSSSDTANKVIIGILVAVVISSVTFFTVAFFFLNPKKNKALIKGLLHKYANSPNLYS